MRIILGILLAISVSSCAIFARLDKDLYKEQFSWNFKKSKKECFGALRDTIKDNDLKVKSSNYSKGLIKTNKGLIAAGVSTGEYSASVYKIKTQMLFKVSGNKSKCKIQAKKIKLWQNNKKLEQVNKIWVKNNLSIPILDGIKDNLSDEDEFDGDTEGEEEDF